MGNSEECRPADKSSPPLDQQQQQTGHVYPDWAAMQAYYGPRMAVPPFFGSGHAPPPYMWGPLQPMMPPYAAMYPHGGVYAHPGVTIAHNESNSDGGLNKKLKGFDNSEGSSDGNTTEGAKTRPKRSSSTSSEAGKTEQSNQIPCKKAMGKILGKSVVFSSDSGTEPDLPATAIFQNDRELKRERRKQSNRESARRSRLRKQAEAEELGGKVESLASDNLRLKSELNRLTVNSVILKLQNAKLLEKLKKAQQEEEEPKMGSSLSTANLLSRVDKGSGSGSGSVGELGLRQLLDGKPRADAVAAG